MAIGRELRVVQRADVAGSGENTSAAGGGTCEGGVGGDGEAIGLAFTLHFSPLHAGAEPSVFIIISASAAVWPIVESSEQLPHCACAGEECRAAAAVSICFWARTSTIRH